MQGKKRQRRGQRKGKDWDDVLKTILLTGLSEQEVTAMSRAQRELAAQISAKSGCTGRGERLKIWRKWSDHPTRHGIYDWNNYLESIGRKDLL